MRKTVIRHVVPPDFAALHTPTSPGVQKNDGFKLSATSALFILLPGPPGGSSEEQTGV